MNYLELRIEVKDLNPLVDLMKQELADLGFESFEDFKNGFSAYISSLDFSKDKVSLFLQNHNDLILDYTSKEHQYENWNEKWESSFDPVIVSSTCVIRASFHEEFDYDYEIIIDPEMSFGTGHHETTRLMSSYLLENPPENKKVLDFGSGTGVLSILSEKLKASSISSVEIDQLAVSNAIKNGRINNCNKIKFIHGSGDSIPNMAYDLILANINKNTIMSQWDYLLRVSNRKTSIVLSGFYEQDLSDLIQFSSKSGLIPLYSNLENNWAILILKYAKNDA